jgi:transcriptional regulator with XRE-family HTH domain
VTTRPEILAKEIGEGLRMMRHINDLTQRQAAKLLDSTQARISDYELGKSNIQLNTLIGLAELYGYDVEVSFVPIEEELENAG